RRNAPARVKSPPGLPDQPDRTNPPARRCRLRPRVATQAAGVRQPLWPPPWGWWDGLHCACEFCTHTQQPPAARADTTPGWVALRLQVLHTHTAPHTRPPAHQGPGGEFAPILSACLACFLRELGADQRHHMLESGVGVTDHLEQNVAVSADDQGAGDRF